MPFRSYNRAASACYKLGRKTDAISYYEKSIDICSNPNILAKMSELKTELKALESDDAEPQDSSTAPDASQATTSGTAESDGVDVEKSKEEMMVRIHNVSEMRV
jgi:hypothetical protein